MSAIHLHPERTSDPDVLLWSTTPATLPPNCLDHLVVSGIIAGFDIGVGRVSTRLAPGRAWPDVGSTVRSALFRALQEDEHRPHDGDDDALQRAVTAHLELRIAPLAASHGGTIRVVDVTDGVLTVEFGGACFGCSAADATLENLVEAETMSRFPTIREVRVVPPADRGAGALARLRRAARFGRSHRGSRGDDCSDGTDREG
jgi:Fe/S biogenesis protein NfuA